MIVYNVRTVDSRLSTAVKPISLQLSQLRRHSLVRSPVTTDLWRWWWGDGNARVDGKIWWYCILRGVPCLALYNNLNFRPAEYYVTILLSLLSLSIIINNNFSNKYSSFVRTSIKCVLMRLISRLWKNFILNPNLLIRLVYCFRCSWRFFATRRMFWPHIKNGDGKPYNVFRNI